MEKIDLDEYKNYLINSYVYECDNTVESRMKRAVLLQKKYPDSYLESVIDGTYDLIDKIFEKADDNYPGFIEIPLEKEPDIELLSLNLTGGWMSDTIVRDSDSNFYSINLLRRFFGPFFGIDTSRVEIYEEIDGDDDFFIMSEIPTYSLYIQCSKEIIDKAKDSKVLKLSK